ncbi:MAG: dienelactone hydrolase [Planctomycetota bacterium]
MRALWTILLTCAAACAVRAEVVTQPVEYKDGDALLEGAWVFDASAAEKRPGVLLVPDWMGPSPYYAEKAAELVKLGYVALMVDMYGKEVRPKSPQEAGEQAGKWKNDRPGMRRRMNLALELLKAHAKVDAQRTAAIGYCFGGTCVLELARSGADVTGIASFHGGLGTPAPEDAKQIKARVLVLHGADDPHVPESEVLAFQKEMRDAKVDWQMVSYGGAVHSFTKPAAGNDPSKGSAYEAKADHRSWAAMTSFFAEIFKAP